MASMLLCLIFSALENDFDATLLDLLLHLKHEFDVALLDRLLHLKRDFDARLLDLVLDLKMTLMLLCSVAGTQVIDGKWKSLKTWLPPTNFPKDPKTKGSKTYFVDSVFAWGWRVSLGAQNAQKFLKNLEAIW